MTSAFLQTELASLIQDSKRKHADVRAAAERSLGELRAISITSESQLAADLLRKLQFIDPFVLACNSKQAKLAITGAVCLQRLVASKAIPRGRLSDVLDAFQEASQQGYEVQLKILQALPSLLQLYASELQGDPLSKLLSLCAGLAASKTSLVSSTAGATFQQLITSVFERVATDRKPDDRNESAHGVAVSDASKVYGDMCRVLNSQKPQFLHAEEISVHLALDVIENCLATNDLNILGLPDCISSCKAHLIPGIAVAIEKTSVYKTFGQCLRVAYLLTTTRLLDLAASLTDVLNTVLDCLDRGVAGSWKRVLCLEFMSDICSDFDTFRQLYAEFDRKDDHRNLVQDFMGTMVRIASEDPSLIGLGRQSTVPTNASDAASNIPTSIEVSDFDAVGSVLQASSNVTGISTKWSTTSSPFLEQTDRKQPPDIPETYIYTLVLACTGAFSEGLSKFIMPLAVPARTNAKTGDGAEADGGALVRRNSQRAQKYQRLQNPLKRQDLPRADEVEACAAMIEDCWPAVLATCSTFLNSALDSYFYHILVRTVQKLAQVSGVMELLTPRDALLTTLAKVSAPINASSLVAALYGSKPAKRILLNNDAADDAESVKSTIQSTPKASVDLSRQSLNVRNLLCLRALLNLGIALGPTLSSASWFIIIQTLQQVEALMSVSPTAKSAQGPLTSHPLQGDGEVQTSLSTEIAAVGTASKRMVESTRTYTDVSFQIFVQSTLHLISGLVPSTVNGSIEVEGDLENRPSLPARTITSHRSQRSVSGPQSSLGILSVEVEFVLKTMNDLARVNLYRFASRSSKSSSWDLIVAQLLDIVAVRDIEPSLRLQAASIVDLISIETVRSLDRRDLAVDELDFVQQACLQKLLKQVELLHQGHCPQQDMLNSEIEIRRRLLDALEDIVSHSGDSLKQGWQIVFSILQLTITPLGDSAVIQSPVNLQHPNQEIVLRTIPVAFRTVQLIVADFLRAVDFDSLWVLIRLLPLFGMQENDLNISLTTTTLFWSINGLILSQFPVMEVPQSVTKQKAILPDGDTNKPSDGSSLWFATVTHLTELCSDTRSDVRNGSIRVLLKILDASAQQLTPDMWNLSIRTVLLQPLKLYTSTPLDSNKFQSSFSQLLSGSTDLLTQHLSAIVTGSDFQTTWEGIISIYKNTLEQKWTPGYVTVFESATLLIRALKATNTTTPALLDPLLGLWILHHPADLKITEDSSSLEFAKHAQLLWEIDQCNSAAVGNYQPTEDSLTNHIMQSTRRTIMSTMPEKYSSDVKQLSPEQQAVMTNLGILSRLMSDSRHEHSEFLYELISITLSSYETHASKPLGKTSKPSFIALMTRCIELLSSMIPSRTTSGDWLQNIAVSSALSILNRVVRTKYSTIPVNESLPLWQKASTVATELLEAIMLYTSSITSDQIKSMSSIVSDLADALLNAPALENEPSSFPSASSISEGEAFDIACFSRYHRGATSLLERPDFPDHDRRKYVLVLLRVSLIAKPWFGDFPKDMFNTPLLQFNDVRAGSIRKPSFYIRKDVPYVASQALLNLVGTVANASPTSEQIDRLGLAKVAAPYALLRLSHTIKTFLADQRLRYLNPPPRLIQKELNVILTQALELFCLDAAFADILPTSRQSSDGRTHLRLLYPLVLRLSEFWVTLPRVQFAAWQDDEEGKAVERSLRKWREAVCEAWSVAV